MVLPFMNKKTEQRAAAPPSADKDRVHAAGARLLSVRSNGASRAPGRDDVLQDWVTSVKERDPTSHGTPDAAAGRPGPL